MICTHCQFETEYPDSLCENNSLLPMMSSARTVVDVRIRGGFKGAGFKDEEWGKMIWYDAGAYNHAVLCSGPLSLSNAQIQCCLSAGRQDGRITIAINYRNINTRIFTLDYAYSANKYINSLWNIKLKLWTLSRSSLWWNSEAIFKLFFCVCERDAPFCDRIKFSKVSFSYNAQVEAIDETHSLTMDMDNNRPTKRVFDGLIYRGIQIYWNDKCAIRKVKLGHTNRI